MIDIEKLSTTKIFVHLQGGHANKTSLKDHTAAVNSQI